MSTKSVDYAIEMLFRRRKIFLEVAGTVLLVVALATFVWPPVYESDAKIIVQDNRAQLLVSPDLKNESSQNPAIIANPVSEEDLNSEVQLLTSDYLVRQAVDGMSQRSRESASTIVGQALGLALGVPTAGYRLLHGAPDLSARDSWIMKLANHLTAWPIKRSQMIEVRFRSHDAKWTQDFLTHLVNGYLDYHVRLSHDPQAAKFFHNQAQILKARLMDSEDQLRNFQIQTGIASLPEQKQALVSEISDLRTRYNRGTSDLASAKHRSATLQKELGNTPQRIGKEKRSVQNNALQHIKPEVMKLEAERAELLTRYQPDSKRIAEIDARLAASRGILNREDHLEVREFATDLNPVWVTLKSDLDQVNTQTAALQAGRETLEEQLATAHQQLTDMVNNGLKIERLEQQVANNKETYIAYVRKGEEARAANELNLNKILNVSIAQAPNEPLEPVSPKVWLNLVTGLLLAAIAGVAAAWWDEDRDEKIYSAATIEKVSGLSTVAVLRSES
jgi:uncharacterized protein involved in exopolysaccharide biosynthesis